MKRTAFLSTLAALSATLLVSPSIHAACGDVSPARPIPEMREGVRIWPDRFRPADPADKPLPPDRDSTSYLSTTIPNALSGHELFWSMDIASDTLFIAYNVGISAWRIDGTFAAKPQRVAFRDGHMNDHWIFHPPYGEADGYITDIKAAPVPGNPNLVLVAVSAYFPVGNSLWVYDVTKRSFQPLYQHTDTQGESVALASVGNKMFAFFANSIGVTVYDASLALTLDPPCLDEPTGTCPGMILGQVAELPTSPSSARYVDVRVEDNGILLAASGGGIAPSIPLPSLVWLSDAAQPSTAKSLGKWGTKNTHSPVFIVGNRLHLAAVEDDKITFRDVTDCGAAGCNTLATKVHEVTVPVLPATGHRLSLSQSFGRTILHHATVTAFPSGPAVEQLFDVSRVDTTAPVDILASGGTYTDPCNGKAGIGYFADTYERNAYGFRNLSPRRGRFNGPYFYRAATAVIDVHVWDGPEPESDAGVPTGGAGGAPGVGGGGVVGGGGISGGEGGVGGTSAAGGASGTSVEKGGCGCDIAANNPGGMGLVFAGIFLAWARRRRAMQGSS